MIRHSQASTIGRECRILPWIEPALLAQAKAVDLYSYLAAAEPESIQRCGQDEYRLADHDSLKVSASTGKWHWHSRGFGGTTAVQYLVIVRGYSLPEAARMVLDSRAAPHSPLAGPPPVRPFVLPPRNDNDNRVIAYLCGQRGLYRAVVERCRAEGTLYESARYHSCVFVGCDEAGTPRHAAIRATGGVFKQDAEGSDKRYTFALQGQKQGCTALYVYEAAIDALSGASLHLMAGEQWQERHYLSLAGVSSLPVVQYLNAHISITTVHLCMDADEPGRDGAERIKGFLRLSRPSLEVFYAPPKIGNDYNHYLRLYMAREQTGKEKLSRSRSVGRV